MTKSNFLYFFLFQGQAQFNVKTKPDQHQIKGIFRSGPGVYRQLFDTIDQAEFLAIAVKCEYDKPEVNVNTFIINFC